MWVDFQVILFSEKLFKSKSKNSLYFPPFLKKPTTNLISLKNCAISQEFGSGVNNNLLFTEKYWKWITQKWNRAENAEIQISVKKVNCARRERTNGPNRLNGRYLSLKLQLWLSVKKMTILS